MSPAGFPSSLNRPRTGPPPLRPRRRVPPLLALLAVGLVLLAGMCSSESARLPEGLDSLATVEQAMAGTAAYSVMLADAREEGDFLKTHALRYAVEKDGEVTLSDWMPVEEDEYRRMAPLKGQTVLAVADGVRNATVAPPGLQHVGDSRYGTWAEDGSGNKFWQYYGQYRLLSDLLGLVMYSDWDNARRTGKTPSSQGGWGSGKGSTAGGAAKKDPDWFARRMQQDAKTDSAFAAKVNQKMGRTKISTRGHGISGGK